MREEHLVGWMQTVMAAVGAGVTALFGLAAGMFGLWLLWGSAAVSAATIAAWWWYPPRYAARLHVSAEGGYLRIDSGVLRRRTLLIPHRALRTFECWSLPLQRRYRCRMLALRISGGASVKLLLPLTTADALLAWLREDGAT